MLLLLSTTAAALVLSTIARLIVEQSLSGRLPLLGMFFGLSRVENVGIAFGMRMPPLLQAVLIGAALLLVFTLAYRLRGSRLHAACFGLIIGGALGNLLDRLDDGHVTDFISVGSFPTFNVADACISVGVAVLLLLQWLPHGNPLPRRRHPAAPG